MPNGKAGLQGWTPLHVASCHKECIVELLASNLDKVQPLLQHSKQDNFEHSDVPEQHHHHAHTFCC